MYDPDVSESIGANVAGHFLITCDGKTHESVVDVNIHSDIQSYQGTARLHFHFDLGTKCQ